MSNRSNQVSLPLWIWGVVAIVVVLLVLLAPTLARWIEHDQKKTGDYLNLARLETTQNPIVMLGSSLTQYALYNDRIMSAKLGDTNTAMIRIAEPSANPKSFEAMLPAIALTSPRLVLVESDMLLVNRTRQPSLQGDVQKVVVWLRRSLDIFSDKTRFSLQWNFEEESLCKQTLTPKVIEKLDRSTLKQRDFKVLSNSITPAWQRFISDIHASGGQVVFINLGRSPIADQALSDDFRNDYHQAMAKVKARYQVKSWTFTGPFEQENYCDFAHLNSLGREVFVNWLVPKVTEALND